MTAANVHILPLVDLMRKLMGGEEPPAVGTEEALQIERAVKGFLSSPDPQEGHRQFGGAVMGLLIDRMQASIASEQLMRDLSADK